MLVYDKKKIAVGVGACEFRHRHRRHCADAEKSRRPAQGYGQCYDLPVCMGMYGRE